MNDKQLMQWMLLVDFLILAVLSYDVYISYKNYVLNSEKRS